MLRHCGSEPSWKEDRRHIKDRDVHIIKQTVKTRLNLEMAATEEMLNLALDIKPYSCCIVPEKRQELTTEGGLDVVSQEEKITNFIKPLIDAGIIVSLFIDADENQVNAASQTGAQYIELHTGVYAESFNTSEENAALRNLKQAASLAQELGLSINAGHGLNYNNVTNILTISGLDELNIGHSIISRAVLIGLDKAVKDMKELIKAPCII
jgi:pyridoxine 5-phosphate synthase